MSATEAREALRAGVSLLAYLWEATGKDPSIRVRDLFAEDDPIVADVAKYSALAALPDDGPNPLPQPDPASPRTAESREPRHMPTICCRAHLLDAAPPPPDDERLRAAAQRLITAYRLGHTRATMSDRIADLALALSDEPGETHEEPR